MSMTVAENESLRAFLDFMASNGLHTTNQRRAIAAAFFELPGHHTLEEFYKHVLQHDESIGQTTVYRTLKLLCDAGLATETHFVDGVARYEVSLPDDHHDHMVCLRCGKVEEIYNQKIEAIQRDIAWKSGFTLTGHVHNLYGVCAQCMQAKPPGGKDPGGASKAGGTAGKVAS
jgi:Fur family ferric uptake transcriptional regulator